MEPSTHERPWRDLGTHVATTGGVEGTEFRLRFPEARAVSVIGDFNHWDPAAAPMRQGGHDGIWEHRLGHVLELGSRYRYWVELADGRRFELNDPMTAYLQIDEEPVSAVWQSSYQWEHAGGAGDWLHEHDPERPIAIYHLCLDSWRGVPEQQRSLRYNELGDWLPDYLHAQGYTHVLFPAAAPHAGGHSAYAPDSRLGDPDGFKHLIDRLHGQHIAVLLDWDPAQMLPLIDPAWQLGLRGPQPPSLLSGLEPPVHREQLMANARYWLEHYHVDGLHLGHAERFMLNDPSQSGLEVPDPRGSLFLEELDAVLDEFAALRITRMPAHTADLPPQDSDGRQPHHLWIDIAWLGHCIDYLGRPPQERAAALPAFAERTSPPERLPDPSRVLPVTHAHGHEPGLSDMLAGSREDKLADLRLLQGYAYLQPGRKLVSMGDEFGQWRDWEPGHSLDWHLLDDPLHQGLQCWVRDLNTLYRGEPLLHQPGEAGAMHWHRSDDTVNAVLSFTRGTENGHRPLLVVCHFGDRTLDYYRLGVPYSGLWVERLNSDSERYGGRNRGNFGGIVAAPFAAHGYYQSLVLTLPPRAVVVLQPADDTEVV